MFERIINKAVKEIKTTVKGKVGEVKTGLELKFLPSGEYLIVNDLTIPYKDGYSQIDHVIFSKYGVFVVETKNYKGTIYGKEDYHKWKQKFEHSEFEFYNPVKQNKTHVRAIETILKEKFPEVEFVFKSIIVFSGEANIDKVETITPVIYVRQLDQEILKHKEKVLKGKDMWFAYDFLRNTNLKDWKTKREHINNIKEKFGEEDKEDKGNSKPKRIKRDTNSPAFVEKRKLAESPKSTVDEKIKNNIVREEITCKDCKGLGRPGWVDSIFLSFRAIVWGIVLITSWYLSNFLYNHSNMFYIIIGCSFFMILSTLFRPCNKCKGSGKITIRRKTDT